jgi:hypothetical protein
VPPPLQRVQHQGVRDDRRHLEEPRRAGRGQQQHPVGEPTQPGEFAGDHPGIGRDGLVGDGLLDELGVAERDGDRGAELVRGVYQEPPLLLQQPHVLLGDPLHLLHRGQPFGRGGQPAAPVQHHDQEHQRDQRDFRQVVGVLLALDEPARR